jgi:hypothetical protein
MLLIGNSGASMTKILPRNLGQGVLC